MIVDAGRIAMANYLKDTFVNARVGMGGNSTSPASTNLDVRMANSLPVVSSSISNSNVVDFRFTVSNIVGYTIREIGIFNADFSIMLTRLNFEGIGPFASGEEVDFYVTVEVE